MDNLVKVIRVEEYTDGAYETTEEIAKISYLNEDESIMLLSLYDGKKITQEMRIDYLEDEVMLNAKGNGTETKIHLMLNKMTSGYIKIEDGSYVNFQFVTKLISKDKRGLTLIYEIYDSHNMLIKNTFKIRNYNGNRN